MFVQSYGLKNFIKEFLANAQETIDFARLHPATSLRRAAHQTTMEFIKSRCPRAISFPSQRQLLDFALTKASLTGSYLELGVYRGASVNRIADRIRPNQIHGFDSFEGLPEDWFNMPKEFFSLDGKLPKVRSNVILHKGFYDQSLPPWVAQNNGPIAFAHIDCDVYASTQVVLANIGPLLRPGTILLFDDYFNQPFWEEDSHKAFEEFLAKSGLGVRYLGFSYKEMLVRISEPK